MIDSKITSVSVNVNLTYLLFCLVDVGVYQCGPSPVAAIQQGRVGVGYDTPFIFAEVNADRCKWYRKVDEDGECAWKAKRGDRYSRTRY